MKSGFCLTEHHQGCSDKYKGKWDHDCDCDCHEEKGKDDDEE